MTSAALSTVISLRPPRDAAVAERHIPAWGPTARSVILHVAVAIGSCVVALLLWPLVPQTAGVALLVASLATTLPLYGALRLRDTIHNGQLATCAIAATRVDAARLHLRYVLDVGGRHFDGECVLPRSVVSTLPQLPDVHDRALVLFDPSRPKRNVIWGLHYLDGHTFIAG